MPVTQLSEGVSEWTEYVYVADSTKYVIVVYDHDDKLVIASNMGPQKWHAFQKEGFLHWSYVREKYGIGETDARNLTTLIGAVTGRTTSEEQVFRNA